MKDVATAIGLVLALEGALYALFPDLMKRMAQQVMQSVSIGVAATLLHFLMVSRGESHLTAGAVAPAFAIIGTATLLSLIWFVRLPKDAGDEMNGRKPA